MWSAELLVGEIFMLYTMALGIVQEASSLTASSANRLAIGEPICLRLQK